MADRDDDAGTDVGAADLPPNAADEKQLAEQRARKLSHAKQRDAFWRNVLADPVGRAEIWNIIGVEAHAFETKFGCGPNGFPQSEATWISHGEQMLGQRLYQTLQIIDFEGAFAMLSEHDPRFKKPAKGKK